LEVVVVIIQIVLRMKNRRLSLLRTVDALATVLFKRAVLAVMRLFRPAQEKVPWRAAAVR
jgi:hypothetical protein